MTLRGLLSSLQTLGVVDVEFPTNQRTGCNQVTVHFVTQESASGSVDVAQWKSVCGEAVTDALQKLKSDNGKLVLDPNAMLGNVKCRVKWRGAAWTDIDYVHFQSVTFSPRFLPRELVFNVTTGTLTAITRMEAQTTSCAIFPVYGVQKLIPGMNISLQLFNRFIRADPQTTKVILDRRDVGHEEVFSVVAVALRSISTGKYLTVKENAAGTDALLANCTTASYHSSWFEEAAGEDRVALRSAVDSKYVYFPAEPHSKTAVEGTCKFFFPSQSLSDSEKFRVIPVVHEF